MSPRLFISFIVMGMQVLLALVLVYWASDIFPALNGILFAASLVLVLCIINKRLDPSYKIVWIIPILALPVAGLMLYFFFSQRRMR